MKLSVVLSVGANGDRSTQSATAVRLPQVRTKLGVDEADDFADKGEDRFEKVWRRDTVAVWMRPCKYTIYSMV